MDEAWHEPVAVLVDGQVHVGRDGLILFEPFSSVQFLFRLPAVLKAVVTFSSILVLTFGLFLKGIILSYLKSSPMKMNPINVLIWIEQLNSLNLSINIVFGLVAINVDRPIRQMAGENFCKLIRLPGYIYLTGAVIWNCSTAIYRIMFIIFNSFMTRRIGEKFILAVFVVVGASLNVGFTVLLYHHEVDSLMGKICNRVSVVEQDVIATLNQATFVPRELIVQSVSVSCGLITMVELFCYLVIFAHIFHHDNHVAARVIRPNVLQQRNRSNVLNMTGQFIIWLMRFSFILVVSVLASLTDVEFVRELAALVKAVEFVMIPVVQILTSQQLLKATSGT